MPKQQDEVTRFNLDITAGARDRLERLRVDMEAASLSEVIRRALATYEMLWKAQSRGESIIIRAKDGEAKVILT